MEETINESQNVVPSANNADAQNGENSLVNNSAENTLQTIASTILYLGIIVTIVCAFGLIFIEDPIHTYRSEKIFNPSGFAITIAVLLWTLTTWASLRVLANISITLKAIYKKNK